MLISRSLVKLFGSVLLSEKTRIGALYDFVNIVLLAFSITVGFGLSIFMFGGKVLRVFIFSVIDSAVPVYTCGEWICM